MGFSDQIGKDCLKIEVIKEINENDVDVNKELCRETLKSYLSNENIINKCFGTFPKKVVKRVLQKTGLLKKSSTHQISVSILRVTGSMGGKLGTDSIYSIIYLRV